MRRKKIKSPEKGTEMKKLRNDLLKICGQQPINQSMTDRHDELIKQLKGIVETLKKVNESLANWWFTADSSKLIAARQESVRKLIEVIIEPALGGLSIINDQDLFEAVCNSIIEIIEFLEKAFEIKGKRCLS